MRSPSYGSRRRNDALSAGTWDSLDRNFRRCLELAWKSYRQGSIPVGAVLTDGTGSIVAEGRNKSMEPRGTGSGLAGSYIAHADGRKLTLGTPSS